jgi:hypothetical protein
MEEWVELALDENFRLQMPADAKASLQDEGGTAVIRLGDSGKATEVLISNFPLGTASTDRREHAEILRETLAEFFTGAVPQTLGREVQFKIEVTEETERSLYYAQGVALIGKDAVWLARAYARRGEERFWLIHWKGPKDRIPLVMRIFVTFDPAAE